MNRCCVNLDKSCFESFCKFVFCDDLRQNYLSDPFDVYQSWSIRGFVSRQLLKQTDLFFGQRLAHTLEVVFQLAEFYKTICVCV